MKARSFVTGILAAALCLSLAAGCSSGTAQNSQESKSQTKTEESSNSSKEESSKEESSKEESSKEEKSGEEKENDGLHTVFIRDAGKNSKMTATFLNTASGKTEDIEMTKSEEGEDHVTFTCKGDPKLYNMVHITYGDNIVSSNLAFNRFTAGWYLKDKKLLPYAEGMDLKYDPAFDTHQFSFDGIDKSVYVWTPKDYDKNSEEKYSTIYMFDGQTILATGRERGMDSDTDSWNVSESVTAMMSVTDNKAVIVGISNIEGNRDNELVPDIGDLKSTENEDEMLQTEKHGNAFADYICDTIMPFIQKNYNVYTDAKHTALAGSSLGGLESFYAVLAHPDKFGTAGVMSASFQLYDDNTWAEFINGKVNMDNSPFLYFYAGAFGGDNGDVNEPVYNMLIEKGYPKDKLVFDKYEPGRHEPMYWRNIYPEFLQAMFEQKVEALECGVPVKYEERTSIRSVPPEISIAPDDPGLKVKENFIYFDNSKTKWDKVFAYWWDAIPTNKISGGLYGGEWPGVEMERVEGTDIYHAVVPMGPTKIVFSSGVKDEDVAKGTIAYQTENMDYNDQKNAGQIFRIDTSVEPKAGRKQEKTKFKYSSGSWEDFEL